MFNFPFVVGAVYLKRLLCICQFFTCHLSSFWIIIETLHSRSHIFAHTLFRMSTLLEKSVIIDAYYSASICISSSFVLSILIKQLYKHFSLQINSRRRTSLIIPKTKFHKIIYEYDMVWFELIPGLVCLLFLADRSFFIFLCIYSASHPLLCMNLEDGD